MLILSWYFLTFVAAFFLIDLINGWPVITAFFIGLFDVQSPEYLVTLRAGVFFFGSLALSVPLFQLSQIIFRPLRVFISPISPVLRRAEGWAARFFMGAVLPLTVACFFLAVFSFPPIRALTLSLVKALFGPDHSQSWYWNASVLAPALLLSAPVIQPSAKTLLLFFAKHLNPLRQVLRRAQFGQGGSARFATLLDEFLLIYKGKGILLGESMYMKDMLIGLDDDRHLATIAGSRGGKGISTIIPNLLLWPENAIVIDPKGENATITAHKRGKGGGRVPPKQALGQDVYVIDPQRQVKNHFTAFYNPLEDIDPNAFDVTEKIWALTSAIVIPEGNGNFWDKGSAVIVAGLIAHVLTDPAFKERRNLGTVYGLAHYSGKALETLLEDMLHNDGCNRLASKAAAKLKNLSENTRGDLLGTVDGHLNFLSSGPIRNLLSHSDFSLRDLKTRPMTIYVCLDPEQLKNQAAFMRIFVMMAFSAMMDRSSAGKRQCLFLMDEFFSLGHMSILEEAAGLMAGYGVKLWPIVQNLTQFKTLYRDNWETFLASACAKQVFAVNDRYTADWVMDALGKHSVMMEERRRVVAGLREAEGGRGSETVFTRHEKPLLERQEMEWELDRDKQRELVFMSGKDTLALNRKFYFRFKLFKKTDYDPDGEHEPVEAFHTQGLVPLRVSSADSLREKLQALLWRGVSLAPYIQEFRMQGYDMEALLSGLTVDFPEGAPAGPAGPAGPSPGRRDFSFEPPD